VTDFTFYTKLDQTLILGLKARNVEELLDGITRVPDSSIYHHTHRFLQQHHYLSPEPPNDFAYWVTEVLVDTPLGEQLSSVDTIQFERIEDLRERFMTILEEHLEKTKRRNDCPPGEEFHFLSARTFAFPTPYTATDALSFAESLQKVTFNSLYFHIFDARLRLEKGENDFSRWFRDRGRVRLADEIMRLDPYTYTMEGLRKRIIDLVRNDDPDS
jgi:hypothetical protein